MALPQVVATGNITDSPTLRHTRDGKPVLNLRIACNERKKDDTGKWVDARTVYLDVTVWGPTADAAAETLDKGTEVTVIGRLTEREYTDREGVQRRRLDITADTISRTIGRVSKPVTPPARTYEEEPF